MHKLNCVDCWVQGSDYFQRAQPNLGSNGWPCRELITTGIQPNSTLANLRPVSVDQAQASRVLQSRALPCLKADFHSGPPFPAIVLL